MIADRELAYVEDVKGIDSAVAFARQGVIRYRKAVLYPSLGLDRFRRNYILFYLTFKGYIAKHSNN